MSRNGSPARPDQLERDLSAILGVGAPRRAPAGAPPPPPPPRARPGAKAWIAGALALVGVAGAAALLLRAPSPPDRPPVESAALPVAPTMPALPPAPAAEETDGEAGSASIMIAPPAPSERSASAATTRPLEQPRTTLRTAPRQRTDGTEAKPAHGEDRSTTNLAVATRTDPPRSEAAARDDATTDVNAARAVAPSRAVTAPSASADTTQLALVPASPRHVAERATARTEDAPPVASPHRTDRRKLEGIDAIRLLRRQ